MCTRVGAGDREAEARAGDPSGGLAAAREALEEVGDEVLRDAGPAVGDAHAQVIVGALGADDDRRLPVAERVRDEVADDPLERRRIRLDDEARVDRDLDLVRAVGARGGDDLVDALAQR